MEIKNMTVEQIEARKAEIAKELETEGADLDKLQEEVKSLNAELEARKAVEAKKAEVRKAVAAGAGRVVVKTEEQKVETRNTKEYIDAFAEYIRTGKSDECRALLTVNAPNNGTVPVPEFLQEIIETAWEKNDILNRVRRTYFKGNYKVPFERSASPAVVHLEGTTAVTEETLTFGLVTMIAKSVKKLVSFSNELEDLRGEAFLRYIYDEMAYRVADKLADDILDDITTSPTSSDDDEIGVPVVQMAPAIMTIPTALAYLSENARDPVIIMNRQTEVDFLTAYAAGNFAVDPFAGLTRIYDSHLPAYSSASADDVYAIVGDLVGAQVNYPEGDDIAFTYDNITRKKEDVVEILARQYAAHDVTRPGCFVNLKKPSAVTT